MAGTLLLLTLLIPASHARAGEGVDAAIDGFFDGIQERFPYLGFRGYASYTLGVDTEWQSTGEDHVEGRLETFLETRLELTNNLLVVGSGRSPATT